VSDIYEENHFVKNYKKFENRLNNLYWQKYWNWYLDFKKFPDETFKQINGYHGFYFISNYGQVISFYKKYPIVRKYNFISGFFSIQLHLFGIARNHNIHDLTYTTFVGPIKPGRRVIHINSITTDNYFKNLKSVKLTHSTKRITGKSFDFSLYNRIEAESTRVPKNTVDVLQFNWDGTFIREYPSIKTAAVISKVESRMLLECLKEKLKTAGGYQWRYKKDKTFRNGICNIKPVEYEPYPFTRKVLKFDLNGNFICEYGSIAEAARDAKTGGPIISRCVSMQLKTAGGFQWRYSDDPIFVNGIENIDPVAPTIWPTCKAVIQFDFQGNFVNEYPSMSAAARETGICVGNIALCIKGKIKSAGGFQWKFRNDPLFSTGIVKIEPVQYKKQYIEAKYRKRKPVLQYNKEGKFIKEYRCRDEAAKENGISISAIIDCLNGKAKTSAGFIWRYKSNASGSTKIEDIEPVKYDPNFRLRAVLQFDLHGHFIGEYRTITEAKNNVNTTCSSISLCASGKYKTAGGFQWRYKDDPIFTNGICPIGPAKPTASPLRKAVYQFDLQGNFVKEYPSITEASRSFKISVGNINACLIGKVKSSGGFQWRYKTHPLFKNGPIKIKPAAYPLRHKTEPVFQFDRDGNFLKEFDSVNEAAKSVGIMPLSLYGSLLGKVKTSAGFQWRYKRDLNVLDQVPSIGSVTLNINRYGPVLQFSKEGIFIKEFSSIELAAKTIGAHPETIRRCFRGESKIGMGFQWRNRSDPIFKNGIKNIDPVKQNPISSKPRAVLQFKMDGTFIKEYPSLIEASRILGISCKTISQCALNKTKSLAGYRWKFRNDPMFKNGIVDIPAIEIIDPSIKSVLQFNLMGNFIKEYRSIVDAAQKLGISKNNIRDCLRGKSRTAGKFQWKYKGDSIFEKGIVDIGPVKKIDQYNCTPVLQFDRNGKFIREYINIKEAAKTLGIKIENIRECFRGRSKTAAGFQWRYINEPRFIDGIVDIEEVIYKNQGDLK
jgi:hypothetical protein